MKVVPYQRIGGFYRQEHFLYLFREMTVADIEAAFEIRTSVVENALTIQQLEEDFDLTPETLAAAMQESAKGWVCELETRVVGFAMADGDEGELTVLAVLAEYEGNGIGKRLLAAAESWLIEQGHKEIWLVTTPDPTFRAYNLYQSQGWTPTGEILDDDEKFVKPVNQ
jgi:ribosomal protein S18 acetylase RimI-like enzyme